MLSHVVLGPLSDMTHLTIICNRTTNQYRHCYSPSYVSLTPMTLPASAYKVGPPKPVVCSDSSSPTPTFTFTMGNHRAAFQSPCALPIASPPYWQDPPPSSSSSQSFPQNRPPSWASNDSGTFAGITLNDNDTEDVRHTTTCWAKSVTIRDYTIVNGSSCIPSVLRPALTRVEVVNSDTMSTSRGAVIDENLHHHSNDSKVHEVPDRQQQEEEEEHCHHQHNPNSRATLGMGGIGAFVVFDIVIETLDGGTRVEIKRRYSEFDCLRAKLVKQFPHYGKALPELPSKSLVSRFRPEFLEQRRRGLEYFLRCVFLFLISLFSRSLRYCWWLVPISWRKTACKERKL